MIRFSIEWRTRAGTQVVCWARLSRGLAWVH